MTAPRPFLAAICGVLLVGSAACGGDSADEERLRAEEIQQARKDGAEAERLKERQREQEREQERLRRELDKLRGDRKKDGGATKTNGTTNVSNNGGGGGGSLSQGTSCGGGLSVGPNTTCPFAENVRSEYTSSGGSNVIDVYSPVTKRSYTMTCHGASITTCTGGNNATVYFR